MTPQRRSGARLSGVESRETAEVTTQEDVEQVDMGIILDFIAHHDADHNIRIHTKSRSVVLHLMCVCVTFKIDSNVIVYTREPDRQLGCISHSLLKGPAHFLRIMTTLGAASQKLAKYHRGDTFWRVECGGQLGNTHFLISSSTAVTPSLCGNRILWVALPKSHRT